MPATHHSDLTFDDLANRLLKHLAHLIHSGETTERRLAGQIDISQPHLHNILNGARKLTPAVADQAMFYLDWSLLDLIETPEAEALISQRKAASTRGLHIDFADAAVGRGCRFPGKPQEELSVPFSWLARTDLPIAVRASADPDMDPIIAAGDILLIDRGARARERLDPDALYVVRLGEESLARWLRYSARGFYVFSMVNAQVPIDWTLISAEPGRLGEWTEGRIIALAQPLDGKFQRPAPPSASARGHHPSWFSNP